MATTITADQIKPGDTLALYDAGDNIVTPTVVDVQTEHVMGVSPYVTLTMDRELGTGLLMYPAHEEFTRLEDGDPRLYGCETCNGTTTVPAPDLGRNATGTCGDCA